MPLGNTHLWRSFGLCPLDDGGSSSFRAKRRISSLSFLFVIQSEAKNLPAHEVKLMPLGNTHLWRSFGLRPLDDGGVFVIQSEAKNLPAHEVKLMPLGNTHLWRSFGLCPLDDGGSSSFRAKRRISQLTK